MPRPKKPGVEPKKRSRGGCWPCKARKVKCGEEKPYCTNCERQGETCDYSIRLNWGGRAKKDRIAPGSVLSSATGSPYQSTVSFDEDVSPLSPTIPQALVPSRNTKKHVRSHSDGTHPGSGTLIIDPELVRFSQSPSHTNTNDAEFAEQNQYLHRTIGLPTSVPYAQHQFQSMSDYPSPSVSSFDYRNYNNVGPTSVTTDAPISLASMPPPRESVEPLHKRHKHTYSMDPSMLDVCSPSSGSPTPYSPFMAMPLTPNSSVGFEEPITQTAPKPQNCPPLDLHRLSVQSLINGPAEDDERINGLETQRGRKYPIADSASTTFGYDRGLPDLDTPNNDDFSAIAIFSPPSGTTSFKEKQNRCLPRTDDMNLERSGYYVEAVPVTIPQSLVPLPALLRENPMNLLYFHHFLNHTARILVPHDCEKNPFRQILPEMAVHDENIMNLLLAYSASHRARILDHPEPANRIAVWVQDVFPRLRQTITENPNYISNSTLAAVIMMASLEIISSNTFDVPVSWQSHLTMARQMITTRGGPQSIDRHDHVAYFLSRWYAYLDVVGSLSGSKSDVHLGSFYWPSEDAYTDEDYEIDCLMGFTNRCVGSLARISELAKQCAPQRIDEGGDIREDWRPSPDIVQKAELIRHQLEEGLSDKHTHKRCHHHGGTSFETEGAWDSTEISATNQMFHWAGLIHLFRRVLGTPVNDPEVQNAVRMVVALLDQVGKGSTAEVCLLFPMFAAGCNAQDCGQREKIMSRLRSVEGFGMTHIHKARSLMQRVWDTGKPWESLVSDEFFG
ncbi:hypothetical protein P153DRAFT_372457 [Dothidotthia symphoricarpi CBS 119687]|uniref:Zn(2)-C6 fungal-type domain-containing protein n=1 Tax=Dothidotthia symphoricarpi CBS 119687 TaxID=1392245 RepID=A0A6A6AQ56_9PLEO|nr:uncharacterized protein P153DRAFT_372457 [Dothidotthia symphoricarpi CBS 119687]KAF2133930.1 hypothetical protein P153DRAFT_372457 [Dothidotthia symphoricarpi CBS 119687]